MSSLIKIAVDAMGGDNSPQKIIDGIELHHSNSKNVFYKIFGDENIIDSIIQNKNIDNNIFEIIHTEEKIKGEDTAFAAAKRGKNKSSNPGKPKGNKGNKGNWSSAEWDDFSFDE